MVRKGEVLHVGFYKVHHSALEMIERKEKCKGGLDEVVWRYIRGEIISNETQLSWYHSKGLYRIEKE